LEALIDFEDWEHHSIILKKDDGILLSRFARRIRNAKITHGVNIEHEPILNIRQE